MAGNGSRMGRWEEPSLLVSNADWRYWRFDCNLEANLLKIRHGGEKNKGNFYVRKRGSVFGKPLLWRNMQILESN